MLSGVLLEDGRNHRDSQDLLGLGRSQGTTATLYQTDFGRPLDEAMFPCVCTGADLTLQCQVL